MSQITTSRLEILLDFDEAEVNGSHVAFGVEIVIRSAFRVAKLVNASHTSRGYQTFKPGTRRPQLAYAWFKNLILHSDKPLKHPLQHFLPLHDKVILVPYIDKLFASEDHHYRGCNE